MEGDPPDSLYFLCKGELAFAQARHSSPDLIYASQCQGGLAGDTDFLPASDGALPDRRSFSVKATKDSELLLLPKQDLLALAGNFKTEIAKLFEDSTERLRALTRRK